MSKNRILMVDDNEEIREIVKVLLSSEGFEVLEAKDGEEAITKADDTIDLFILDIMMPKVNGYQACIEIRKISNAPILFLTAKGKDSDKTLGFSSGGDDYLAKPFSYNELTVRVKALLRRYQVYQGKSGVHEDKDAMIYIADLCINESKEEVFVNDKLIELTDIEYRILHLLSKNRRHIFSAEHLFQSIWEEPYYYSANNTIMVHIRNLRKKIEKDPQNPQIIRTVWGKGYRCD